MLTAETKYPISSVTKDLILLKNFITNPNIQVGDYTYYHDSHGPENFEKNNVVIIYTCKLIIGKFCQIAEGTQFIMSDANHQISGFSTYPFFTFPDWKEYEPDYHHKGDTIVGNDVWFGHRSTILPGVKIGDGAIIGACSVVTKDVPPYTIVAGNPARVIRKRFADDVIEKLLALRWWDWDYEKITRNVSALTKANLELLKP